jgi:hypothetical protein
MTKAPSRRRNAFRLSKEVRKLARERVGTVPPGRAIQPATTKRKKPKHPKKEEQGWLEG